MLDFIRVEIVAVAQIIMAAGTVNFWIKWFRTDHVQPWLPKGYIEHERCFVYPDSVMSVLMIASAILLFMGHSLGERLSLVCGGMMLFLAIADIAYFKQNNMFVMERGGKESFGLVIPMVIMSLLMILRFI